MPISPNPKKYPMTMIFYQENQQSIISPFLQTNQDKLWFSYEETIYMNQDVNDNIKKSINKLFSEDYNVFITIGNEWNEYIKITPYLTQKMNHKWIHFTLAEFLQIDSLNQKVLRCFIHNLPKRKLFRPTISCFTTSYKSFDKILRPFRSLLNQTFIDWEWVIIDDSDTDDNFQFIKQNISSQDYRVRLFKKDYNSGNIGNVKNEAVSLCRGEYVLELDHDDEILHDTLEEIVNGFKKYPEVGFVYMNFAECYENYEPFTYGPSWGFGYGGYYSQTYNGRHYEVATSVDINDVTMSNIVGVPNHPRAWRKSVLMDIGNYNEALPIADDYELLVLTCLNTKMLKINKLGYVQFKNNNNNNFSLIRNFEITKLQRWISHVYYQLFNITDFFKNLCVTESIERNNHCINITIDSACSNQEETPSQST